MPAFFSPKESPPIQQNKSITIAFIAKSLECKCTGIDLVAITFEGDNWAIQCKCYQEDALIDKPGVDSFLSTSGREFKNENLKTTGFSHRLWISTTNNWGPNAYTGLTPSEFFAPNKQF